MKKLLTIGFMALLACGTSVALGAEKKYVDPNPFADYGPGMKHTKEIPLGSYWQQENKAKIAEATTCEKLAAFVACEKSADALLAQVAPAYKTDPIVLTQIGAVTQWVMLPDPWYCLFWNGVHADGREIWVAALERALKNAKDDYRKAFYADQLRWCGFKK